MTVTLHKDSLRSVAKRERRLRDAFLESTALGRDILGLPAQFASQQGGIIVLDGEDAARLTGDDGRSLRGPGMQTANVLLRHSHGPVELSRRDERPATTDQLPWTERNGVASSPK